MAATCGELDQTVLIVDDFGSWDKSVDLIVPHASDFDNQGYHISSADGSAMQSGKATANSFSVIDWFCADAGKYDPVLVQNQQEIIMQYLENGGNLLISGSNIGYYISAFGNSSTKSFYQNYLKAAFFDDAPDDKVATYYEIEPSASGLFAGLGSMYFDDGTHDLYNVREPDMIAAYKGGNSGFVFSEASSRFKDACVYFEGSFGGSSQTGRLVYITVPYETLYPDPDRLDFLTRINDFFQGTTGTALESQGPSKNFELYHNFPNPFNPQTTIAFKTDRKEHIRLEVFSLLGQSVKVLVDNELQPGRHEIIWQALNEQGENVPSGVYFCQLRAGDKVEIKRLVLIR